MPLSSSLWRRTASCVVVASVVGAAGADASALRAADPVQRATEVVSFDGTRLAVNFMPAAGLKAGRRAPTVLFGPGYSQPGWTDAEMATDESTGEAGTGDLRRAGYNVVTWDPRGFGSSTGRSEFDDPAYEGRDVQAIIDYVAKQPEVALDRPGDPRLGMVGGSYGGNIQLVVAALDRRVDVITPTATWHDLADIFYQDGAYRSALAAIICSFGLGNGTTGNGVNGETRPPGSDPTSVAPEFIRFCTEGQATGTVSAEALEYMKTRGAHALLDRVKVPTLLMQGTSDATTPLQEAVRNHEALADNGIPLKMLWYCGGHEACNLTRGPARVKDVLLNWLARYLDGRQDVSTGAGFEYVDQDGVLRGGSRFPLARRGTVRASGSGTLALHPGERAGGGLYSVAPSSGGLHLPLPATRGTITGTPVLTMSYTGTSSTVTATHVYAQVVDLDRNTVVGQLAAPIPVTLDGQKRTVTRTLQPLGYTLTPATRLEVQLISSSGAYGVPQAVGALEVHAVDVGFPLTVSGARLR